MSPRWSIIVVLLALAGCVGDPAAKAPPAGAEPGTTRAGHGILEGSVADANFVPIHGVTVKLDGVDASQATSWNGKFRFEDLAPGTYRVTVGGAGWVEATLDARVQADRLTRLTIFLDPLKILEPYSDVRDVKGQITCLDVQVADPTSLTCMPQQLSLNFAPEWAAVVTEIVWGPSGFSSSSLSQVTAQSSGQGDPQVYARLVGPQPARVTLLPGTVHDDQGGVARTPPAGEAAPLQLLLRKDPAHVADSLGVGLTLQQSYEVYHTTFYREAPADLSRYSALPE